MLSITIITAVVVVLIAREDFTTGVLGAVGGLLQGTLGTAVALAGAYVAIRIAALSYQIVTEQKQREDFFVVSQTIESGLQPLIRVTKGLRDVFGAEVEARAAKDEIIARLAPHGVDYSRITEALSDSERMHFSHSARAVFELADALEDAATNSYAAYIWQEAGRDEVFWLDQIDFGGSSPRLSVYNDPHEIVSLLRVRARRMTELARSASFADVLVPRLVANATKDADNNEFDNVSVRTFLEAGAGIWSFSGNNGVANVGAAILFDISRCIPATSTELESAFVSLFGDVANAALLKRVPLLAVTSRLGAINWYGSSFGYALKAVRQHKPRLVSLSTDA